MIIEAGEFISFNAETNIEYGIVEETVDTSSDMTISIKFVFCGNISDWIWTNDYIKSYGKITTEEFREEYPEKIL